MLGIELRTVCVPFYDNYKQDISGSELSSYYFFCFLFIPVFFMYIFYRK